MSANAEQEYDRDAALANLTEEERAALEDDGMTDAERQALQDILGDDDQGQGDDDDEDDDGEEADDDSGDEDGDGDGDGSEEEDQGHGDQGDEAGQRDEPGGDDGEAASSQQSEDEDDEEDDASPVLRVELPEDFDDRMASLDTRESDLIKKFKDGDIEVDEFVAETNKITGERAELNQLKTQAAISEQINAQNAEHQWTMSVRRFIRDVKKSEGVDYAPGSPELKQFDSMIKALAQNPENNDKPFKWFLNNAHKATKALLGITTSTPSAIGAKAGEGKPASKPAAKPQGKQQQAAQTADKNRRKPPVDKVPANLAGVPGGDGPGDVGDEFAELDKLEGLEYEEALARLPKAQRERYLSGTA